MAVGPCATQEKLAEQSGQAADAVSLAVHISGGNTVGRKQTTDHAVSITAGNHDSSVSGVEGVGQELVRQVATAGGAAYVLMMSVSALWPAEVSRIGASKLPVSSGNSALAALPLD